MRLDMGRVYAVFLAEADARDSEANTLKVQGRGALAQLEKAYSKQKAAEDAAAAARRKQENAERETLHARGQLEELQKRFDAVKQEAEKLRNLNAKIADAQHAGDLFA